MVPQTQLCNTRKVFASLTRSVMESSHSMHSATTALSKARAGFCLLVTNSSQDLLDLCEQPLPFWQQCWLHPCYPAEKPTLLQPPCSSYRATSKPLLHGPSQLDSQQPTAHLWTFWSATALPFASPGLHTLCLKANKRPNLLNSNQQLAAFR